MIDDKYEFTATNSKDYFEFVSIGPQGDIRKAVQFTLVDKRSEIFNLGMGDIHNITGKVIDKTITNNKDTDKILSTIGEIARQFLENKPNASILIEGNSTSRNRLYRMGINKNLDKMVSKYTIFGLKEQNPEWERFNINSDYIAFLINKIN